jgi:hypothetical protein
MVRKGEDSAKRAHRNRAACSCLLLLFAVLFSHSRQKIESEPVPVRVMDNTIDRIALTSLTADEQKERKEKQHSDSKLVLPKIFESAKIKKKGRARVAVPLLPPRPPAAAPAAAGGGFGFPFHFGAFSFGAAAPAAAAAAAPARMVVDDDDDDDDYDEDAEDDEEEVVPPATDIYLEHARSGRAQCRSCRSYIAHGAPRFGVTESDGDYEYYQNTRYYHVQCYARTLPRGTVASSIRGFNSLTASVDQPMKRRPRWPGRC